MNRLGQGLAMRVEPNIEPAYVIPRGGNRDERQIHMFPASHELECHGSAHSFIANYLGS